MLIVVHYSLLHCKHAQFSVIYYHFHHLLLLYLLQYVCSRYMWAIICSQSFCSSFTNTRPRNKKKRVIICILHDQLQSHFESNCYKYSKHRYLQNVQVVFISVNLFSHFETNTLNFQWWTKTVVSILLFFLISVTNQTVISIQ